MGARAFYFSIAIGVAALFVPRVARAAPSARLVYARGPGAEACPDEGGLRKAIASRVGYDPFFPWAPLTVSVEVMRDSGHFRGRIVLEMGGFEKGAQTIDETPGKDGATCEDLLDAIALAVSVALDAARAVPTDTAADSSAPAEPEKPPAPVVPAPDEKNPPTPARKADESSVAHPSYVVHPHDTRRLSLWVAPGARVGFGAWPAATLAPDLFVELRYGAIGFGLEGRYDFPVTVTVGPNEQASIDRATGSFVPCFHVGWFTPCAIATLGENHAAGVRVEGASSATALYAAFGGRVGADVALVPRLHLLGTADVVGTAPPIRIAVGPNVIRNSAAEASVGIALLVSIF